MPASGIILQHRELGALERAAATLCAPFAFGDLDGWRSAVNRALCPIVEADLAIFYVSPAIAGDGERSPVWTDELSRDQSADFIRHALHDAGTDRALAFGLRVVSQTMLVRGEWEVYQQDPAVNAFYLPNKILDAVGFLSWDREGRKEASIEIHKSVYGTPLFDEEGVARLRLLLPAFQAGVAALKSTAHAGVGLATVLDRLGEPLALADSRGRLTYQTNALAGLVAQDPDGVLVEAGVAAAATRQAALFEARGWGRRHRADGSALAAGQTATTTVRTRVGVYRVSVVEAPDSLTAGRLAFLVRVEAMFAKTLTSAEQRLRFGLTDRELEVARLLAAGASNGRVAGALGISPHTARRHTEKILAKLGVSARSGVGAALRGEATTSTESSTGAPTR